MENDSYDNMFSKEFANYPGLKTTGIVRTRAYCPDLIIRDEDGNIEYILKHDTNHFYRWVVPKQSEDATEEPESSE